MPRPIIPKPKDVAEVLAIARALRDDGFPVASVTTGPEGWSIAWGQAPKATANISTAYDEWQAIRGES